MSRQVLKTWPEDFHAIRMGQKRAEVRRCDDRRFRVGDEIVLEEWDPIRGYPMGGALTIRVTHVESMAGPLAIFGLTTDVPMHPLAVLSFELLP